MDPLDRHYLADPETLSRMIRLLPMKDGGIIREGYNEDVDKFRSAQTDGKKWLSELEARETGNDRYQKPEDQIQ